MQFFASLYPLDSKDVSGDDEDDDDDDNDDDDELFRGMIKRVALTLAGTIARDPHYRESPTRGDYSAV